MFFMKTNFPTPYYAVIFTSKRSEEDTNSYQNTAFKMSNLAVQQSGYLGQESYRNENGKGVTISYWQSLEDIQKWKENITHQQAQKKGKSTWYEEYNIQIAKVEKSYFYEKGQE